jgi:hypothetical protein
VPAAVVSAPQAAIPRPASASAPTCNMLRRDSGRGWFMGLL